MADTWRENAIVLAILIIADKKIAQAGYDRTIKGVINKVIDSATGKYLVRYQDSLFEAYATSSKITYTKDQLVSVLIPGNDWDRVKTILSGIDNNAINYQLMPVANDSYNTIGPNGISLPLEIKLSSYVDLTVVLPSEKYSINFSDISDYIKKGNSIALGMKVRTAFADGQIGGRYGLKFNLIFQDSTDKEKHIIKSFEVNSSDVIGHPYQLTNSIWVENLITGVETDNFVGISSIEAYCDGFPLNEDKSDIKDIFISDIKINGASALSDLDLSGIVLHIDDSTNGNTLNNLIIEVPLIAKLKVNGKVTTLKVVYYWFRLNGMIFRGNEAYSGYAGDGWECLNVKAGGSFVPKEGAENIFTFINGTQLDDNLTENIATVFQRVTKILCVAVYDNKLWIKGEIEVVNTNVSNNFYISTRQSFEVNVEDDPVKDVYFLDNGTPTLKCNAPGVSGENIEYIWSVKPARGRGEKKEVTIELNNQYAAAAQKWHLVLTKANNMAATSAEKYRGVPNGEYTKAKNNFELVLFAERIQGNEYINFPISSIIDYSTVTCAVVADGQYRGTASLTLYNKPLLEGMYSLNLEHGSQVFQYDGKGNSPTSPQLEKPLLILPLTFTLIDNEGKLIGRQQIKDNGYIKWIIPNKQTLLKSNLEGGTPGLLDLTVLRADLPLAADDYTVYSNLDSFSYSIEDRYDEKCNINYIWLNVKFKDMILDAYTNFTFPKDGDPGTNGTDFVAKLVPAKINGSKLLTDRAYIDSNGFKYIDNGDGFDKLIFSLYNNSIEINNDVDFWTCPPKTSYDDNHADTNNANHYVNVNSGEISKNNKITPDIDSFLDDVPVDIVRAQQGTGNSTKYFAEYPICYNFINTGNYRFKVKPKTGFKYAVYAEDGTLPDYDNTMPFEIIILSLEGSYYTVQKPSDFKYEWYTIGQIELDEKQNINNNISINLSTENNFILNDSNKAYFKPFNKLDSSNLTNAIVVRIKKNNNGYIGYIHIPIYMIINRYGHSAINSWDGTSILMKEGGDTILAPQVGAGTKNNNNQFTGVLIGDIKSGNKPEQGLFGYHLGLRSIFLDANTGNATFGVNGEGQIKLIPGGTSTIANWKINQNTLQGGNITLNKDGYIDVNYSTSSNPQTGIRIDGRTTSDKVITTGSGNFSVSRENGYLYAKGGGKIASWKISDTKLTSENDKITLLATNGSIYSEDHNSLTANNNGYYIGSDGISLGNVTDYIKFRVTSAGKLTAKDGQIANWTIGLNNLTNGNVGLGSTVTNITGIYPGDVSTSGGKVTAKIWSGSGNLPNFAVSNNGYIYSKAGKIGGWKITDTTLSGGNTIINSSGSLSNSGGGNGTWAINNDGSASFTNINASGGKIGNYTISSGKLTNGNVTLTSDGKLLASGGHIGGVTIDSTGLHGTGFDITDSYAKFTGLEVGSEGITSSGSGISPSGGGWGLNSSGGSVGGCGFGTGSTTGNLAVDTLEVGGVAVTWKDLNCVSSITPKRAVNVFSAPTTKPTYKISGSITVPGYTFSVDGTQVSLPARTVDCSGLTISTESTWNDFKKPITGISFKYFSAKILGASDETSVDDDG